MGTIAKKKAIKDPTAQPAVKALLLQLYETELGGVQVYETALRCVKNKDLKKEWESYLEETRRHVEIAREVVEAAGLDPDVEEPSRLIVRMHAETLVNMMGSALEDDPDSAELVACECVVAAETKDHQNWTLLGHLAKHMQGELAKILKTAVEEVEEDEDHHYYHTRGWCRELWLAALDLPAVLPPPEEEKKVSTAMAAARAEANRGPAARQQRH